MSITRTQLRAAEAGSGKRELASELGAIEGQQRTKCGKFSCHSSSSSSSSLRFSKSIAINWLRYKGTETSLLRSSFLHQTNQLNNWRLVCPQPGIIHSDPAASSQVVRYCNRRRNRSLFAHYSPCINRLQPFISSNWKFQFANQFSKLWVASKLAQLGANSMLFQCQSWSHSRSYSSYCSYFYIFGSLLLGLGSVMEQQRTKNVTRRLSTR